MCPEQPSELLKKIEINENREPWEEEAIKNLDKEIKRMPDKELDQIIDTIGKTKVTKVKQKPQNASDPDVLIDTTLSDTVGDFEKRITQSLNYKEWMQNKIKKEDITCIIKDLIKVLRYNRFKHENWIEAQEEYDIKSDEVMLLQVYINAINERQGRTPLAPVSMQAKRLDVDGTFWPHTLNGLLLAVWWEMAAQEIMLDFWAWDNNKRQPWTKWIVRNGKRYVPIDIVYTDTGVMYDGIQADLTDTNAVEKIQKKIWQKGVDEIRWEKLLCCILKYGNEKKDTINFDFDGVKQVLTTAAKLLKKWKKAYFSSINDFVPRDFQMINGEMRDPNGEREDCWKAWDGQDFDEIFEGIHFNKKEMSTGNNEEIYEWFYPDTKEWKIINARFWDKCKKIAEEISKECGVTCEYTSNIREDRFPPWLSFEMIK